MMDSKMINDMTMKANTQIVSNECVCWTLTREAPLLKMS